MKNNGCHGLGLTDSAAFAAAKVKKEARKGPSRNDMATAHSSGDKASNQERADVNCWELLLLMLLSLAVEAGAFTPSDAAAVLASISLNSSPSLWGVVISTSSCSSNFAAKAFDVLWQSSLLAGAS